jgi:hydrogenase-4 component F
MVYIQVFFPIMLALIAMIVPSNRLRPWLLPVAGVTHTSLTLVVLIWPKWCFENEWLILDPIGKIVLINVSLLFLLCSFYAVGYLGHRKERINRIFVSCLLAFIGLLSLVTWSHHLGLMWVAIEGTTLMTAPLIYFNKSPKSIEATWKYLMVGSVGIALALLGTFFLAYSALQGGVGASMSFQFLLENGSELSKPWLQTAFILLLIGYGTKMGLAPMHTWKPDAYGEAPGVVGALLAGGITSGAFLALTRIWQICATAGETAFISRILIIMGLFSIAVAGIYMINQRDFKRMLAYSSIEHMGILALGLGIGLPAMFGTLFHLLTSTMTKGLLFLSAGNIHRAYASKSTNQVRGALHRLPLSGTLFVVGFLAITGTPPFGPFASEFLILKAAFSTGHLTVGGLYLLFMLIVFIGMGITVLNVVYGEVPDDIGPSEYHDGFLTSAPLLLFLVIILIIGFIIPTPLRSLLDDAVFFMSHPV